MSRKIKFRGKRVDNGEWIYGSLINNTFQTNDGKTLMYIIDDDMEYDCWEQIAEQLEDYEVIPETVGQYITKDDYNNNVYEGDIKQLIETYLGSFDTVTHLKAIYLESEFKFIWMDINDETNLFEINEALNCRTIGNVSEHLKLLKDIK